MSKKRTYKSYTQEFKEEAVALVTEQGYTVPKAAESLGIRTNQLYQWKQKIEQSKQDILLNEDEKAPHSVYEKLGVTTILTHSGGTPVTDD